MAEPIFTFLSLFTIACAVGVIASRNTVNGAMCLLLSLIGVAGLFVQLHAYLLGFFLLLIYGGAVAALFLFIIMLLDVQAGRPARPGRMAVMSGIAAAALFVVGLDLLAKRGRFSAPAPGVEGVGSALRPYASELFTRYLLPVELIGLLLLIAMVGVIVVSKRIEPGDPK